MYNAINKGESYYIVNRVTDHHPKHNIISTNLKLKVLYKVYGEADRYDAESNRGFLKRWRLQRTREYIRS
jgi:hypothetical protein